MMNILKKIILKYRIMLIPWCAREFKTAIRYIKYNIEYFGVLGMLADGRFETGWSYRYPCLRDATPTTFFDSHYLYHMAWAARLLIQNKPASHIDISSSLYFVTIISSTIPIHFYDYRPAKLSLTGLSCDSADIRKLTFENDSIESVSCMHVVEHIGLGRYGDEFDSKGDMKAISELKRVVANGGSLYFVVPIGGRAILQFNAHRIYTYAQIVEYFAGFDLVEFALVCDDGSFLDVANQETADKQQYGCGCFLFKKVRDQAIC